MPAGTRFTLEASGLPPDTFAVVTFHLSQSLSSLFILDVTAVSANPAIDFSSVVDEDITLTIWQGDTPQRRVKGVVTWCEQGDTGKHQTAYRMRIRPPFWRSSLRQNCRSFQNQDIRTILFTLLKEMGVLYHDALFGLPHPVREFCVQFMETDFDFASRLMAEEGIYFYEEEDLDAATQKLIMADKVDYQHSRLSLPYNPNGDVTPEYCIRSFRRSTQIRPAKVVSQDYTFTTPNWRGQFTRRGDNMSFQRSDYEIFDYPGRFKDELHGAGFARYQLEGLRNNAECADGSSNSPQLWPGMRFTLSAHPRADLNVLWQVVESELHGEQPQAQVGNGGTGTTLVNDFTVIPGHQTWRPAPEPKPLIDGPQTAVVTGPPGEEIFCDKHGRVRVKFTWDRYNAADQDSSCWVRVSQAWAGTGFGNLAIPRVGQEVIVDFLNGDPDQPIIMGRTYHQDNRSPGSLPGTKTQMAIRSKTYKGGGFNELMFEDKTGQELLSMHAQKDMDTKVLHDRKTTVIHDHTENVGNDQKVRIKNDRKVLIGHDLRQVVLNDQRTTTLKNKKEFTGLTSRETVGVLKAVTVGGAYQTTVIGEMNTSVLLAQTEEVGVLKSVTVKGPLMVSSGTSISFTCGASAITMDLTGKVTISGTEFDFSSSGPVAIKGKDVDIN
ncbi:type VI secretion system tip protein VgrG [Citrobacter sp. S2-9]|uniref:Type VI secretion system tip protein VgrG n=1 Tax=Citrobacter enshiensis TaxID=2971264 RepID=A0ABT8Q1W8_9ENTR|nr:type VI secretion system tip protein VgrG [Citrobacter enshiensis]MDN8602182.1 type VI secretion system tip protein VgrG [Citrobacter enshiensis]